MMDEIRADTIDASEALDFVGYHGLGEAQDASEEIKDLQYRSFQGFFFVCHILHDAMPRDRHSFSPGPRRETMVNTRPGHYSPAFRGWQES